MNSVSVHELVRALGVQARVASAAMAQASAAQRAQALRELAALLRDNTVSLQTHNGLDVARAQGQGLAGPMVDRLKLTPEAIETCAQGCEQLAAMPDPIGEISGLRQQPSGIRVGQMRVPLGVIGIIYESRPNVTIDAAALCLKSGNATILRGGSEAIDSNTALAKLIQESLAAAGLPSDAVQVVETTDRAAVGAMITMNEYIDVIVPRGGKSLIERLMSDARVPMIKHLDGICHTYIDVLADSAKAIKVCDNAKTQRYGTCNTTESLLVARSVAKDLLPRIGTMLSSKGVEIRGCAETQALLPQAIAATEQDWFEEFLAPIIAVKVVAGLDEAITHINTYSSQHTESIVTDHYGNAMRFLREVDSASVMVNASTRFADGFEYGLGAEIGISTDKLHARGPVGLEGLTSLKYVVFGDGHIRT